MFPQGRIIIGIFDRDNPKFIKEIGDKKDFGNNVFAFCLPIPNFRQNYQNTSIEFYYDDKYLKKEHLGKRLFFSNEIATSGGKKGIKPTRFPINPISADELIKTIEDENINEIKKDGVIVAHSKTEFARLVATDDNFIIDFDFKNFQLLINRIQDIIMSHGAKEEGSVNVP